MINSIEVDGQTYTAIHWFDIGLPKYLHHCLDGTQAIYADILSFGCPVSPDALETIFSHYEKDRIKQAFFSLENEFYRDNGGSQAGVFLLWFSRTIRDASSPINPYKLLARKEAKKIFLDAQKAIASLKKIETNLVSKANPHDDAAMLLWHSLINTDAADQPSDSLSNKVFELHHDLQNAGRKISLSDMLDTWLQHYIVVPIELHLKSSRPGSGDFQKRRFCQYLCTHFASFVGKPMCREVAAFSSALYSETDENYVQKNYARYLESIRDQT